MGSLVVRIKEMHKELTKVVKDGDRSNTFNKINADIGYNGTRMETDIGYNCKKNIKIKHYTSELGRFSSFFKLLFCIINGHFYPRKVHVFFPHYIPQASILFSLGQAHDVHHLCDE